MTCPFCNQSELNPVAETTYLIAFRDKFPISPGHTLIVPKRHATSFFDLDDQTKSELLPMVSTIRDQLTAEFFPDGFNVGWNDGAAAGQTVFHFHLHVIPRYKGDVKEPRGGIRWTIASKAPYWSD